MHAIDLFFISLKLAMLAGGFTFWIVLEKVAG